MMFNVIVIMSLAGRQCRAGKRGEGAAVDCCSCVSFVWLQELRKWAHPLPSVSSVGFQVSIFNTNLHPHSSAKDRSEPNNFGYYVKNHKKTPKFDALWPFFPLFTSIFSQFHSFLAFFIPCCFTHLIWFLFEVWCERETRRGQQGSERERERRVFKVFDNSIFAFPASPLTAWA